MKKKLIIKQAFEKAVSLHKSEQIVKSKQICEDIIQKDDTRFDAHYLLGLCFYRLEDFENAITSLERAIELNPNEFNFYIKLSNAYSALKLYEKAKSVLKKAIELDSSKSDVYLQLGNCYVKSRDYKNGLIFYKKAVKINNRCCICYYNMADTYNKIYKYDHAIFYLQKLIKICPDYYEAFYSMAQCYKQMKNERKMLEYLHITLQKLPEHPGANHLLASYNGETTSKYSSEYAKKLFNNYADYFEEHLLNSLKYQVPFIIKEKLKPLNIPKNSKVLDLGCGTGLIGKNIVDLFPDLVGVDISANMIEETRKKEIYTELHISDINDFLLKNVQEFHLVIAADVFLYIGDLEIIFSSIKKFLNSNGYFLFTIELSTEIDQTDFQLGNSRRFSHSVEYIENMSKDFGFEVVDKEEIILRQENKIGQKGAIFILQIIS